MVEIKAREGELKFPPPSDTTPMIQCDSGDQNCGGKFYPFYYGRGCDCYDCRMSRLFERRMLPGHPIDAIDRVASSADWTSESPTAIAAERMNITDVRLVEAKLAPEGETPESEAALRREIERQMRHYNTTGKLLVDFR